MISTFHSPLGIGTISRGRRDARSLRIQATPFPLLTRSASSCLRMVTGVGQGFGRTWSSSVTSWPTRLRALS